MIRVRVSLLHFTALLLAIAGVESAYAADSIQVFDVKTDTPTVCCLGFSVPISDDDNYDASATIEYRLPGNAAWKQGLPLLRVRPELTSMETTPGQFGLPMPDEQFAGSLFQLTADTQYEIKIIVTDPDGGDRVQVLNTTTRRVPRLNPLVPNFVTVANTAELNNAITAAQAGDVIELVAGTYSGPITIIADGTESNPIIIRGTSAENVTINAVDANYGINIFGSHVYIEHVTVTGSYAGVRSTNTEGTVIQFSRFTNVIYGILANSGVNRNHYICDNFLEGRNLWPAVDSSTWNDEGISISGEGHTVCHNTLSGFGDALGLSPNTSIPNIAIDFYGNDILWTADDALELDYAHRNVRAFSNRGTNVAMGVSLQPIWGGPVYIFKNIFLNIARSPYKLEYDPSGFFIFNNTSVRTLGIEHPGMAWSSVSWPRSDSYAGNFQLKNNILFGVTEPAYVTTNLIHGEIDYNGWSPDGAFRFVDVWVNFADLQSNSPYEDNGRILDDNTFTTPIALPTDYRQFWRLTDVTLGSSSLAIDNAQLLPNINDSYNGSAPDLGAIEHGTLMPSYGVRKPIVIDVVPPTSPKNVSVE